MPDSFNAEVTIRQVRFANPDSGWAVLEAAERDGTPVTLVGPLVHLEERERAHVSGEWVTDSRYGAQVKVAQAAPLAPEDRETLVLYLKRIRHVGTKRALALVECHGPARVLDVIDADPQGTFAAVGLRHLRGEQAADSWRELRITRRLHLMLAPHGLAYLAGRIHEHYGNGAHEILARDPYELTSVFGVGFAIADRIARAGGSADDPSQREKAAVMHALGEAERSGSTCLPDAELRAAARALIGQEPQPEVLEALVTSGALVREQGFLYRAATAELESELAGRVDVLVGAEAVERLRVPDAAAPEAAGLTEEQGSALTAAFAHRLSVITGGPGTGKTASIKSIATTATAQGLRVMLVAPTGRAAVRMTEASGLRARTVHSALGWVPGEGPSHDEHDPLACELLIVDETSMANLELLVMLLRAVGDSTHVVLVGDADQLAPVGAGKPFAELVQSDRVPSTRLTHIFRQAAGSMIVQAAHAIRQGRTPTFRPEADMRRDLFLIERNSPTAARDEIVSLVAERLPAHYGIDPITDIQVFAPVYRGELGIDAVNQALRTALNPDGRPVRGGRLRIGDKLMMTGRNLHELGLMNGTVLRLLDEIDGGTSSDGEEEAAALLLAADEAVFRLPPEDADRLRLAYACSVHRGQGIELPVAVIIAHPAAGAFFLRREMLYTAITRARLATVVVGDGAVLARAVATPDTARRHGRLGARLAQELTAQPARQATNAQLDA
ncbi:MAG: exodeoxyribonuclease alpha subunit [Solirubrobacteraceae bacterium]|nr:exodeoxyribonuclease alpha subunit [Solirubrobacteraceae bacterium]